MLRLADGRKGRGVDAKILCRDRTLSAMSLKCREVVLDEYSLELQARRYHKLYQRALVQHR